MPYYLDGFKGDNNVASWKADLFLLKEIKWEATESGMFYLRLVPSDSLPPENVRLTHKQLAEYGFFDWLKTHSNPIKPDYFMLRWYGPRPEQITGNITATPLKEVE